MQLLNLRNQKVKKLKVHGEVNDMQFMFWLLPKCLQSLEIYSKVGVHDVRSLNCFFELELNNLIFFQCYEVCSHPECVNYNSITSQIKKCSKFPKRLAMAPFPFDAIKWCENNGVCIDFQNSAFFEFEFDAKRLDRTGYEVLKTERDILMSELRGLGAFVMDWEPDMMLNTALAGARGF